MPQTATAQKPEAEAGKSAIERLLSAISATEVTGYKPKPVERCEHYVEVGIVEDDWIRKQIVLRLNLFDRMDVLNKELRAQGENPDKVMIAEYEEASFMTSVLGDMIVVDLKVLYPDLKKAKEGIEIDADWMVGYTDHSAENFFKTLFGENGPFGKLGENGLPEDLEKKLFGENASADVDKIFEDLFGARAGNIKVRVFRPGDRRRPSIFDLFR